MGLEGFVHFPGFLQEKDLIDYYVNANAFIQPSLQDQWGLVVNEAMASGLAILASRNLGCFSDLIKEGVNGYGFDPYNLDEMATLMSRMSNSPKICKEMGVKSRQIIAPWSLDLFADNLLKASQAIHP